MLCASLAMRALLIFALALVVNVASASKGLGACCADYGDELFCIDSVLQESCVPDISMGVQQATYLDDGTLCADVSCADTFCGDGTLNAGEECDDGFLNDNSADCLENCALSQCGDGLVNTLGPKRTEECDLGANNSESGPCSLDCEFISIMTVPR